MTITTLARNVGDLRRLAPNLLSALGESRAVRLEAPMGAGKTTLVAALAAELGAPEGVVASPTFAIVNDYPLPGDHHLYHFDLYRLTRPEQLDDLGFGDYLRSGEWCMIEWPELAEPFLDQDARTIRIVVGDEDIRKISVE